MNLDKDIITALRYQVTYQNEQIAAKDKRIRELETGACRFNCRTEKQAFIAGYLADIQHEELDREHAEMAYQEWREKG